MKETIDLLGKILTNILTALYEPFGFSLLLSFLAMFFYLYAYEPAAAGKGWKSAIVTWYQKFKESVFFRKANHYQGLNVHMNDAITQLKNHMEYINRNYSSFRTQIHEDKDKAINEEYSGNYLVGPRKNLLVDPQKDIDVKYIAIGGVEREDKSIEESHEIVKCKPADNLEIASWNSFVRKLDEYHGHHPVQ